MGWETLSNVFSLGSHRSYYAKPLRSQHVHYKRNGSDVGWHLRRNGYWSEEEIVPAPPRKKKPKRKRVSPQKVKPVETRPVETKPELPESEIDVERFRNLETAGDK
jgi:hypothetical protein